MINIWYNSQLIILMTASLANYVIGSSAENDLYSTYGYITYIIIICHLYRDLLANYSSLVRPVKSNSEKLKVSMKVFLQQIVNLDEKNQVIEINAWLKYKWEDYRLKWDPKRYDDITSIRLPATDNLIWTPDILLYNSADKSFDSTFKSNLVIYYNGVINWIPPGIFRASCVIRIHWYPFDYQSCFLKFGSWTYHGYALDLQIDTDPGEEPSMDLSTYIPSSEWVLESAPAVRQEIFFSCCPQPYPTIKFYMNIRRRTLYYIFNLIIPSLLIGLMTLLGFCLPAHDMSEKIGFETTILLSVSFFLTVVSQMIPETSDGVPLLGLFFSTITLIVTISTTFTILVLNFRYRQPCNHKMSGTFKKIFLEWLPWLLLMRRPEHKILKTKTLKLKDPEQFTDECLQCLGKQQNDDDYNSRETILYGSKEIFLLNNQPKTLKDKLIQIPVEKLNLNRKIGEGIFMDKYIKSNKKIKLLQYEKFVTKCVEIVKCTKSDDNNDENVHALAIINYYNRIRQYLAYIRKQKQRDEKVDDLTEDYKFASMALDRLCMILFSLFIFIAIIIIFSSPPYLYA
uniref:Neur_chan_LBD domain-containing protein n=1 Tax=Parastrongyloides trichosuri TaxID=131310 RepID=A0A0N4ZET5_PARTI